jgi:OmpA-OmpF porin, OOP family
MTSRRRSSWLVVAVVSVCVASAQARQDLDVKGSSDHPRVSRFAGSVIMRYSAAEFDRLVLPLSTIGLKGPLKSQDVEGRSRRIMYRIPEGHNSHEVFRTYQAALKKDGFQTLHTCLGDRECGGWPGYIQGSYNVIMGTADWDSQRYIAAKRPAPEGDVYVMLYTWDQPGTGTRAILNIVDVAPLKEGLVTVTATELAKQIGAVGHVAVYGVYFDFDRADIKSESAPALREMATLLEQQPTLSVAIVGHTDNVGTLEHNLLLSERRAATVVKYLVSQHQVSAARLMAKGVGPLSPVASNKAEEGRAKNRRVELVER